MTSKTATQQTARKIGKNPAEYSGKRFVELDLAAQHFDRNIPPGLLFLHMISCRKIFALILSKMSEASIALVRNSSDAETMFLNANNPIRLWKTIEATHIGGSSSKDTQVYHMIRTYQMVRQDNTESVHAYYERSSKLSIQWRHMALLWTRNIFK